MTGPDLTYQDLSAFPFICPARVTNPKSHDHEHHDAESSTETLRTCHGWTAPRCKPETKYYHVRLAVRRAAAAEAGQHAHYGRALAQCDEGVH